MSKLSRWQNVLFWAVISAAFIGPGTVATAASAGSGYELSLMWALLFSVIGCVILQEASSRITIVSGLSLGDAIGVLTDGAKWLKFLVGFSVIFGCAAYQAGNILGAVSGLALLLTISPKVLTLFIAGVAGLLLALNSTQKAAYYLGFIVAAMGLAFMVVALQAPALENGPQEGWITLFYPSVPAGSELLVLGLVGTTIVPYNLFLGSGISHGHTVSRMRQGLIPAIVLGGLFSAAVIVCGTLVSPPFTFEKLFMSLQNAFGPWAGWLFSIGLFAAGFTSAVTAPMAAGLTLRMTISDHISAKKAYNIGWVFVWLTGLIFGLLDFKPIPVILMAQALNGLVLPVVTFVIALSVNHRGLMSATYKNGTVANVILTIILAISSFLGLRNILRALEASLGFEAGNSEWPVLLGLSGIIIILFFYRLQKLYRVQE